MGELYQQSQTAHPLEFLLVSSTDHITGVTGLGSGPTVTLSKDGGAFASPATNTISEVGNGWYKVAINATDFNTLGLLVVHATGTGADPTDDRHRVVLFNPDTAIADSSGHVTVGTNGDKTGCTVSTVSDKTGYSLTSAEHTAISGTDVPAGLTARGLTAALVELLAASAGSWTLAGNVLTMTSFGGGHTFTVTVDSVTNPTTWTVAQTS